MISLARIIVDTSSILFALSRKLDVFEMVRIELAMEPIISKGIENELSSMSKGSSRKAKQAKVALALIRRHKVRVSPDSTYPDSWIISQSGTGIVVCTNDSELRKNLRLRGVGVYTVSEGGKFR